MPADFAEELSATLKMFIPVFKLIFTVWWLLLIFTLFPRIGSLWYPRGIGHQRKPFRNPFATVLAVWIMLLIVRIVIWSIPVTHPPIPFVIIPEPTNTVVFLITGVCLFLVYYLLHRGKKKRKNDTLVS